MKLPIALLLMVLKQKKHMQTEPRELLFIQAQAQSLQWRGTGSLLNKKGTNSTLVLRGQGPVFVALGRWMEALRRCALPVRHPVAFVSPRAAAALREERSCSLRSPSWGSAWPAPTAGALGRFLHLPGGNTLLALRKGHRGNTCCHLAAQGQQLIKRVLTV